KVHTLKARISQIKIIQAGESVSYNRSFVADKEMKIAILSIGYADGLPRNSGTKRVSVNIKSQTAPILGIVCMDLCMIDVSNVPDCKVGDEVEIFGKQQPIEILANACETIPYEILCGISPRVKRIFIKD
ncbi:MAG TPA: alanine racemase C-terminal domain-containing protein, partial [Saprospiraceae bacterium]|nr:alanine racemase C-terminal domain-containing protein [Saprospiraceae bacterium]